MKPFETLGETTTPEGHQLTFQRRDGDYFLILDGYDLMSTRRHTSESALAKLACRLLPDTDRPRVLIGGLGLGYTLRAALDELPKKAEVVVAEIFHSVVEWNARHLAEIQSRPLDDRRVRVHENDVRDLLAPEFHGRYHAILLDVDNSPAGWCLPRNSRLYNDRGLSRIKRSLSPGGILAVWSVERDSAFAQRLRKIGFTVSTETVRAHGDKGSRHTIFLARASD